MLRPKVTHLVAALAIVASASRDARADDAAVCNAAYEDADVLLRAGGDKLLEAKEKLLVCAGPACKPWMVKECTKSLSELEVRLPSVVFDAKDSGGQSIVDVSVAAGDRTIAERLDGRAITFGPGERTFVFTARDGRRATVTTVVREGEKAQKVTAVFPAPDAAVVPPPPAQDVGPPPPAEPVPDARRDLDLRTVGYVVGGAGIVGLAVGSVFGLVAVGAKSDAQCNDKNQCQPGPLSDARSAATVSTVAFVGGAVLVAAGLTLVLLAPSKKTSASITAAPMVSVDGSGAMLRGAW